MQPGMSVKAAITISRGQAEVESAWQSFGSEIAKSGQVRFSAAPGDQGTEIHVAVEQGAMDKLKGLFGDEPAMDVKDELRRFKQIVETGEIVGADGTPEGESLLRNLKQRPAQPVEETSK